MPDDPISESIPEETKKRPMNFENAPDFLRRYINQTVVLISPFDIQMVVGEIIQATEEKMQILAHAHLTMSPEHAKALYDLLGVKIKEFESKYRKVGLVLEGDERKDLE